MVEVIGGEDYQLVAIKVEKLHVDPSKKVGIRVEVKDKTETDAHIKGH